MKLKKNFQKKKFYRGNLRNRKKIDYNLALWSF